jgi:DNA-binding response OmpR family regulator
MRQKKVQFGSHQGRGLVVVLPELDEDTALVASSRVILIVEDDRELRGLFRIVLTLAGFTVEEAGDGISALRLVEEHTPDLIVLDLALPTLGGISVRQDIAAHAVTRDIPIVVVTAFDGDLSFLAVPCILRKPVSPDALLDAINACLQAGKPATGSS